MNIDILKSAGIDYDNGVQRFLNDKEFYEKMLVSFLDDTVLERANVSFATRNIPELVQDVHEVKGVSGNMDMKDLYKASCALIDFLRSGASDENTIASLFDAFKTEYERVKKGIADAS